MGVALGLNPGDRVEFVELEDGRFTIVTATCSVKRLKGMARKPKATVNIDDMNTVDAGRLLSTPQ
ncbi:AbrB family transcriptional regulator [Pseudomonas jessenii]|uniref:AbrB family transcriptional regulator n=1 Tax=Pseudomonas jessenii TaxID=77298 RepID=UPI0030C3BA91